MLIDKFTFIVLEIKIFHITGGPCRRSLEKYVLLNVYSPEGPSKIFKEIGL